MLFLRSYETLQLDKKQFLTLKLWNTLSVMPNILRGKDQKEICWLVCNITIKILTHWD